MAGCKQCLAARSLSSRGAELLAAESEKNRMAAEADELIEFVDEDIQKLKKQVEELTHANEILTYENLALPNYASGTRRRAVLEDIIKSNNCKRRADDCSEQLKNLLRGYKTMSGSMKRTLQDMGFVITDYGDGRYMATLAKTPSDNRSGMNIALEMIKDMF